MTSIFPNKTNVTFTEFVSRDYLKIREWERGTGETIGCGTGCATAVVTAILTGRCDRKVTVEQIGGPLLIEWDEKTNHLFMTGPSHTVFESEIDASHILQQDDRKNLYEKRITVLQVFLQPDLEIKNDTLKEKTAVKKKETIK